MDANGTKNGKLFNLYIKVHLISVRFITVLRFDKVHKVEKLMDLLCLFHIILGFVIEKGHSLATQCEKSLKSDLQFISPKLKLLGI